MAQRSIVAVDAVGGDPGGADTRLMRVGKELLRELGLGGKLHFPRDFRLLAPPHVLGPFLGKIERAVEQRMSFAAGIAQKDSDLTVFDTSRGATVLTFDADGLVALFEKSALIKDEHGFLFAEMLDDIRA